MRSFIHIFFFSLFIIGIQLISADDLTSEEVFTQASKEIDKNNYDKALSLLNSLVTENHFAPEVFFQIGNANYRKNNIGESILGYKRALLLNPSFKEARQNLSILKQSNEFVDFEKSRLQTLLCKIPLSYISLFLGLSLWVIGLGVLYGIINGKGKQRSIIISLLGALLFIISLFTSIQRDNFKAAPNTHVITSINSTLKSSPTDTASNVIQLNLGSNIRVISARNNWAYIEAPNDLRGWIRNKSITKLWPYNYELIN